MLGKYGHEADKLVYTFTDRGDRQVGLRYDQTVPLARVLSQHQHQLLPHFRRYQIQNVFRADKPQKGRFREFTQCDLDIIGSSHPVADAEILAATFTAFKALKFPQTVFHLNDRQGLIDTLSPFATAGTDVFSIIQTLDKLDKLGQERVLAELTGKGIQPEAASALLSTINGLRPSDALNHLISLAVSLGVPAESLIFTPTLARGLDYYTGMIFEVSVPGYETGALGGGGRYDRLIGELGGPDLPAVGVGLGFDRILEAAEQLNLIPGTSDSVLVLVTLFDSTTTPQSLETAKSLRQAGIPTEVFPNLDTLSKQLAFASKKHIPFVIIIGEEELGANQLTLKTMATGEQEHLSLSQALSKLSKRVPAAPVQ